MSMSDVDDLEATGHFLSNDTWWRLTKLREHVAFLASLARPRPSDESKARCTEIRPEDVASCLELLGEQIAQVLDEVAWPAERRVASSSAGTAANAGEHVSATDNASAGRARTDDAGRTMDPPAVNASGGGFLVGLTLDQIDEIGRLLDCLRAHGNVVTCSDHAELSDFTLSIMGDAISRDVARLREIMGDVAEQTLEPPHVDNKSGVREDHASYLALPIRLSEGGATHAASRRPTYQ